MSITVIRAALETRLANWAAAQSTPLQIAYQNASFDKPADGSPWLEAFLMPNVTMNREVTGKKVRKLGLFQVNVWAKQGNGQQQGEGLAEAIVALYPVLPVMGGVAITQMPHIGSALSGGDGWQITPVLVKYRYES